MAWVTYIEHNGTEHRIELNSGVSVMQGAVSNMIPGIEGDCGGLCACATCHVYVDDQWLPKCAPPEELETNILDFAFDVEPNSRLACQIKVDESMDGMIVRMPERQY
jgi:2Fe-2S ferredoxin